MMLKNTYNSEGMIDSIFIKIDNFWAQVPWVSETRSINWDLIEYLPTGESIQSAWDAWAIGKDLTYELRDRPDLIPPIQEEKNPDWGLFNRGMLLSQAAGQILITTTNQYQVANLRSLVSPAGYTGGLSEADYPVLQFIWGAIIDGLPHPPTVEVIAELNAIAVEANMVFSFNQECKIEIAS